MKIFFNSYETDLTWKLGFSAFCWYKACSDWFIVGRSVTRFRDHLIFQNRFSSNKKMATTHFMRSIVFIFVGNAVTIHIFTQTNKTPMQCRHIILLIPIIFKCASCFCAEKALFENGQKRSFLVLFSMQFIGVGLPTFSLTMPQNIAELLYCAVGVSTCSKLYYMHANEVSQSN